MIEQDRHLQEKVNAGYAADMKELIASDGSLTFIAPSGLGWQAVNDLVNAAKSGTSVTSAQVRKGGDHVQQPVTRCLRQSLL